MAICEALAKQLNKIRKDRGLTVTEFSCVLDISRSSLQSILSCKANPRSDTIEHIAGNLQIDPIALLSDPSEVRQPHVSTEDTNQQLMEILRTILGENHE